MVERLFNNVLANREWGLVGHPEYYRRFGFQNIPGLVHEGVLEEVFFTLSLDGHILQGIVEFHLGFNADGQQEGAGDALPAHNGLSMFGDSR